MKNVKAIAGPDGVKDSKSDTMSGACPQLADDNCSYEIKADRLRAELRERQLQQRLGYERFWDKASFTKAVDLEADYDLIGKGQSIDRLREKIQNMPPWLCFLGGTRKVIRALREELSAQDRAIKDFNKKWGEFETMGDGRWADLNQMQCDQLSTLESKIDEIPPRDRRPHDRPKSPSTTLLKNHTTDRERDF